MRYSDTIELISESWENSAEGVSQPLRGSRRVFCRVRSISSSEFFRAGQEGLRARWQFTVWPDEYRGETLVRYGGQVYGIYRTYRAGRDALELYAELKAGTSEREG